VRFDPILVDFHGQRPDQPQATLRVGKNPDYQHASLQLLIDPLEHIYALEVLVALPRQPVKNPGLLDVGLHPFAKLRMFALPTLEPPRQALPRLLHIPPVIEPPQLRQAVVIGLARRWSSALRKKCT
jgi:hypothetical protein